MCKFYIKPFLTNKSQSIQSNFKNGSSYEQKSARLGTFFFGAYSIPFINLKQFSTGNGEAPFSYFSARINWKYRKQV